MAVGISQGLESGVEEARSGGRQAMGWKRYEKDFVWPAEIGPGREQEEETLFEPGQRARNETTSTKQK